MVFPAASPRNWLDQNQYVPDIANNDNAIAQDTQGNIYYGSASMYSWGPPNGPATWIDLTTGQRDSETGPGRGFPKPVIGGCDILGGSIFTGAPVMDLVSDGAGGWYMGGSFTLVTQNNRSFSVPLVAHINADGSLDEQFNLGAVSKDSGDLGWLFDPIVYKLYFDAPNNRLYLAGNFSLLDGFPVRNLAAVDGTTGAVIQSWDANVNGTVYDMHVSGTTMYIGGIFGSVQNTSRLRVASWSIASFPPSLTQMNVGTNGQYVFKVLEHNGTLYVAGDFDTAVGGDGMGGTQILTRNGIFAANPSQSIIDASFDAQLDNEVVYVIHPDGGSLVIGGDFTTLDGVTRNGIAKISASDGSLDAGFDAQFTGSFVASDYATAIIDAGDGINLYVGGTIFNLNGDGLFGLIKINKNTGAVDTSFNPHPSNLSLPIFTLLLDGNYLWASGCFMSMGATTVGNDAGTENVIIKLTPDGVQDTTFVSPSFGDTVFGIQALSNGNMLVRAQNTIYYVDSGATIVWSITANSVVQCAVERAGNLLLLAGSFSSITATNGTFSRSKIVEVSDVDGSVTSSFSGGGFSITPGSINSMVLVSDTLYFVGSFTTVNDGQGSGNVTRNRAAAFTPTYALNTLWNPNFNATANVIAEGLLIGGNFTTFGGATTCRRLCRVDGNNILQAEYNVTSGSVSDLLIGNDGRLYVAGTFTSIGGVPRTSLAEFPDTSTTTPTSWNPGVQRTGDDGGDTLAQFSSTLGTNLLLSKDNKALFVVTQEGYQLGGFGGACFWKLPIPERLNILGAETISGQNSPITTVDIAVDTADVAIFGSTGIIGPSAGIGPTGLTVRGLTGTTGLVGPTGLQGQTGIVGGTGVGIRGLTGIRGITGANLIGASPALPGQTGLWGATGVAGTNGMVTVSSSSYAVTASDYMIFVDSTAGPVTLNFPNPVVQAKYYSVFDIGGVSATNNITLTAGPYPPFDGAFEGFLSYIINTNFAAVDIHTDVSGAPWYYIHASSNNSDVYGTAIAGVSGATGIVGITGVQGITGVDAV